MKTFIEYISIFYKKFLILSSRFKNIPYLFKISKNLPGFSLFTTSMLLSQATMMLYALILARYLGPEKYGYFASGYSLMGFWAFFINFGMDNWMLQKGGKGENSHNWFEEIIRSKFQIFIFWAPIFILLTTILKNGSISPLFLLVCAIDIYLDCNSTTYIYKLNIEQRYNKIMQILMISRLGRLFGLIFFIIIRVREPINFALSRSFFTGLGLIVSMYTFGFPWIQKLFQKPAIPIREILPFGFSDIFAQIYVIADVSLLSILAGNNQVGLYNPATQIISSLLIIPNTIHISLLPVIKKQKHGNGIKFLFPILSAFISIGMILTIIIVLGSRWVTLFFLGKAFVGSGYILMSLSPIILFKSIQFGFVTLIVSEGLQKFRLIPQVITAILNVTLNFLLIPLYGAFGSAVAYNVSEFFLLIGYGLLTLYLVKNNK